jgi:hypothetical protein
MNVIHVNFSDKEHYILVKKVNEQLELFGIETTGEELSEELIACALDEVSFFKNIDKRDDAINKLIQHYRTRRAIGQS